MHAANTGQQDTAWQNVAKTRAHGIRRRTLALTLERNGCYLSQALSSAEILATLYTQVLNLGESLAPAVPPPLKGVPGHGVHFGEGADYNGARTADYDRFLISPAHYAVAIYAALVETGRMDPAGLEQFNTDGSTVEMIGAEHSPGFELTTGSFGQAVSQAGGIALARKVRGESGRVFVFMSDGELEEGQTWEAVQALAFYKLDNVIVYVDVNGQQVDGLTKDVMNIEPIDARLEGFGATAIKVDGHDVDALADAINHKEAGKPLFVLCYTNSAEGIPMLETRKPHLHFVRFKTDAELAEAFLASMNQKGS
ncbi:MAG: 1-deoxy-D-xylulose-5-phosphate synthase N-terminal domain-containing protein [Deinococcota bacterium]